MDPDAVDQAKVRLRKAETALATLTAADSFEAAEDAWTDFLTASATIYSKLEQGAKAGAQSRQWFGQKKKQRKDDPLLRYLHHARNSDEHGIERVISRFHDTGPIWGQQPKFGERIPVNIQAIDPDTGEFGEPVGGFYPGSRIKLIRVHDRRYGDSFDVPGTHLGQAIPYPDEAADIASLGLAYLRGLVDEAEGLVQVIRGASD